MLNTTISHQSNIPDSINQRNINENSKSQASYHNGSNVNYEVQFSQQTIMKTS